MISRLGSVWRQARELIQVHFTAALALSLAFKALNFVILAPIAAATLRFLLARWGRASVGNFEVASFLLSPWGALALVASGGIFLASFYLETAGLMRLLADRRLLWWQAFGSTALLFRRLLALGMRQLIVYLVLAIPFLAAIGGVYLVLWHGRDLNGLLILRPAAFWWGAGLAAILLGGFTVIALHRFLRWILAVPILLFESDATPRGALTESRTRTGGRAGYIMLALAGWAGAQFLLVTVAAGLLHIATSLLMERAGKTLGTAIVLTEIMLLVHTLFLAGLNVVGNMSLAAIVLAFYRQAGGHLVEPEGPPLPFPARAAARSTGWILGGVISALAVLSIYSAAEWLDELVLQEPVEITAHRGGAARAPENTVAAIRQAIADQAEWAEVDVQLSRDQALVVLHDIDLARIGGGSRRVDASTLAEIQSLDVGRLHSPAFAGERVPILDQVLEAARGKLRLNVELKPHGPGDVEPLTRRVIEAIRKAGMVDQCRLCSQSYEGLQLARQIEPRLPVGFIVSVALGDVTRLQVDFLMVQSDRISRSLVDRARAHDVAVHAWTVNDPAQLAPLIDRGVANVITDDPAAMRTRRAEIRALSPLERLLLRTRHALAG